MTNIVFRYDGLLDKYMGDAIMAVYGAPLYQPDHAKRACLTALAMMDELRKLQDKWREENRLRWISASASVRRYGGGEHGFGNAF